MAIKNSRYNVKGKNGFDTFHFETGANQVKILNRSKSDSGNLGELLFSGKTINSGDVSDIKVSGIYKISNLTGLPSDVSPSRAKILLVKSVGEIGDPSFVKYELIDDLGNIFTKVISNGKSSDWTNGGKEVSDFMRDITSKIGSLNLLDSQNKSSLVSSINEILKKHKQLREDNDSLKASFDKHNHDSRYVKTDGSTSFSGDISLLSNASISASHGNGKVNVVKSMNSGSQLIFGNNISEMNIHGKGDLLYNGRRVLVAGDNGSGVNADQLNGVDGDKYARKDIANVFKNKNHFESGLKTKLIEADEGTIELKSTSNRAIFNNIGFETTKIITRSSSTRNGGISFFGNDGSEMSLLRSNGDHSLILHNNKVNRTIFRVDANDNIVQFDKEIMIKGLKLYVQKEMPSGTDHPVGSIWIGG